MPLNKQVSIIGCGWLGFPLAQLLIKKGFKVKGTTTSESKLPNLGSHQIEAFYLKIAPHGVLGDIKNSLSKSDVVVLNIPPGLRKDPNQDYVAMIKNIIPDIEISGIKKVLFIGSTSVYADDPDFPEITEKTIPNPNTESGRQLLQTEQLLQKNENFKTTIVRFSGLFGNERHPAKQLSGRTFLRNAYAPVNLVHLADAVSILFAIIEQNVFGETFNVSTTPHPDKESYYTLACKSMGLPLPKYDLGELSQGKLIVSTKLERILNYKFQIKL